MSAKVTKCRRVLGELPYERWATIDQVAKAAGVSYSWTSIALSEAVKQGAAEVAIEGMRRGGRRLRYRKIRQVAP
jgi:hypothetical protein